MGLLDKFRFRNRITDPETNHRPVWESLGSDSATYLDMSDLMEIYHTIPHVKCAVNALASMTSNGNYKVVKDGEIVENHPLVKLLDNPNFLQHKKQFIFNYTVNKHVYGNAYIFKNNLAFSVGSMFVLPTEDVRIEFNGKLYEQNSISGIIERITINQKDYETDDLIFLKENDDRLVLGESKLLTLKQQISNIKHAYDARNVNITQRGATGILSLGNNVSKDGVMMNPMTPKEKKQAEENITKNYGLTSGKKRTIVTTLNASFVPMSFPTKDLQLFEEIEDDTRVILDTFGLNDNLFSKIKGSTFNNVEATLKRVYQDTIIPNSMIDSAQIGKQSGMLQDGETLIMDFTHLPFMSDDMKKKAEIHKLELEAIEKALTLNLITQEQAQSIYDERTK